MKSSNLFSYFKPAATSNGTAAAKTPSKGGSSPSVGRRRRSGGPKRNKIGPPSASKRTPTLDYKTNDQVTTKEKPIAMEAEECSEVVATPTSSSHKRPHPLESDDSEGEIGVRRVSHLVAIATLHTVVYL